ncbi:hypothetical protein, partial [Streptomyces sp. uw30]|uniref:hypothetical protein n=1 Tax=Streptomyces sp. uw30 TaxID=1828179 RepID=UPI001C9BDBF9
AEDDFDAYFDDEPDEPDEPDDSGVHGGLPRDGRRPGLHRGLAEGLHRRLPRSLRGAEPRWLLRRGGLVVRVVGGLRWL